MFKRLTSLLDLDHLRTPQNSALGTVWIVGKLLYALVIEQHIQHQRPGDWDRLDQPRRVTPWRLVALARRQVDAWIFEVHRWHPARWAACLEVMTERPRRRRRRRRRRFQTLPAAVIALLSTPGNQLVV